MTGSHRIIIDTKHIKYDFTIRRNITVILGDSGSGKTTLVEYLRMYSDRGPASGITLQSDVPCVVFTSVAGLWKPLLNEIKHSIIFIDEGQPFIFTQDFAESVKNSDNYYVLITRRPIHNLPYSTKEIYGIRTVGKYSFPEKVYQEFYPIYETETEHSLSRNTIFVLEDSNAGYEFFQKAFPKIQCISAGGNAGISAKLHSINKNSASIVMADGAAFGAYIENILSMHPFRKELSIYLPESFEWIILRSGIIDKTVISEILEHPEDFIDSSVYFSWERYFTALLEKETGDDRILHYSKDHLPEYFLSARNIRKILEVFPDDIKQALSKTR